MTPERIKRLSQTIAAALMGNNDFITIPDRSGKPENIGYHELTEIIAREMSERCAALAEIPLSNPPPPTTIPICGKPHPAACRSFLRVGRRLAGTALHVFLSPCL